MTVQLAAIPHLPVYSVDGIDHVRDLGSSDPDLLTPWCKVAPSDRSAGTVNWRAGTRRSTGEHRHRRDETMLAALRTQLRPMR